MTQSKYHFVVEGPNSPANNSIMEIAADGDAAAVREKIGEMHRELIERDRAGKRLPSAFFSVRALPDEPGFFGYLHAPYSPGETSPWRNSGRVLNHTLALLGEGPGCSSTYDFWRLALRGLGWCFQWQDTLRDSSRDLGSHLAERLVATRLRSAGPPAPGLDKRWEEGWNEAFKSSSMLEDRTVGSSPLHCSDDLVESDAESDKAVAALCWAFGPALRLNGQFGASRPGAAVATEVTYGLRLLPNMAAVPPPPWQEVADLPPGGFFAAEEPAAPAVRQQRALEEFFLTPDSGRASRFCERIVKAAEDTDAADEQRALAKLITRVSSHPNWYRAREVSWIDQLRLVDAWSDLLPKPKGAAR